MGHGCGVCIQCLAGGHPCVEVHTQHCALNCTYLGGTDIQHREGLPTLFGPRRIHQVRTIRTGRLACLAISGPATEVPFGAGL